MVLDQCARMTKMHVVSAFVLYLIGKIVLSFWIVRMISILVYYLTDCCIYQYCNMLSIYFSSDDHRSLQHSHVTRRSLLQSVGNVSMCDKEKTQI